MKHLIGRLNHLGVRFVGALGENHLHEFLDDVDIGLLERALLDRSETFVAAGSAENRIAGCRGRKEQVLTDAIQAAGICKRRELNLADLLGLLLAGKRHADRSIGADRDARLRSGEW